LGTTSINVMRGLDSRICRWQEMAGLIPGSSPGTKGPAMTTWWVKEKLDQRRLPE
jgi:hypothetical protein